MNCSKPIVGVYLIDSLSSGGAQRQFVELVKGIDRKIITPLVVVYYDLPFFYNDLINAGIKVHLLPKKDKIGISFIKQFITFLREVKPDFIHSFLKTPNFYARVAKIYGAVPRIITSERNVLNGQPKIFGIVEKVTWRLSDHIIANAYGIKYELINKMRISPNRISVVHNGAHIPQQDSILSSDIRKIFEKHIKGKKQNVFIIGLIGRLVKQKNHSLLLDAIKVIKDKQPNEMIFFGFWGSEPDYSYKKQLMEKIESLEINDYVHFYGTNNNIGSVYNACDLIVLPSIWEGFPNVVLEAMAMEKVVIASDIVDNSLIIKDGYNGFLLSPDEPKLWANKIMEVYNLSESSRHLLEERAGLTINENFTLNKMIENTMAVYKRIGLC